jgi:hypothetical protein
VVGVGQVEVVLLLLHLIVVVVERQTVVASDSCLLLRLPLVQGVVGVHHPQTQAGVVVGVLLLPPLLLLLRMKVGEVQVVVHHRRREELPVGHLHLQRRVAVGRHQRTVVHPHPYPPLFLAER